MKPCCFTSAFHEKRCFVLYAFFGHQKSGETKNAALSDLPLPYKKGQLFFSLYVVKPVLILPHVCLRGKLNFAFTLQLSARFGVGYAFFSTRQT
jgi:hypothetical protein